MGKLIKTDIGLIDVSDVINVTIGFFQNPFETLPTICLHKKGLLWNKKKYIHFETEETRDKVYKQIVNKITID